VAEYRIIDEPRPRTAERLIVDPTVILFAAMLVPILSPWLYLFSWSVPLLWWAFNCWLLRSPNWRREAMAMSLAVVGVVALIVLTLHLSDYGWFADPRRIWSYSFILQTAVFFGGLYYAVFQQANAYAIFVHVRRGGR
jgi:hypothetical protein